ncbi:hypothetical protein KVR01_013619 [Diaporthe batatas]|uniref:uncharacterized protein n=1 Tax=Diaporthe batatas TaxID=748121 RepID=UPI001D03A7DC|nr:uncharacterized protein KVR01_013619 [Diaporthe batatas]KAG8156515.1 hypothetical protein KVR01_013619 [Diaporthe batatas]
MSRLLLNKPVWRICATAVVAVLCITLLLTGWNSYYRKRPTYFVPPETVGSELEHKPDHVDSVAPGDEPATITLPGSISSDTPAAPASHQQTDDHGLSADAAANATLGVAELIVINMPDRTDKRDRMTLMGSSTGLRFTFLPGVDVANVPDSAMPPGAKGWTGKVRASWRAHMDALWYIVQNNLTSAIIFEDDLDWDVRIREQARDFALASRALLQPLAGRKDFADPTYPTVQEKDKELDPPPLNFNQLPKTQDPATSPYGDGWDVLWLGHCGVQQPTGNPKNQWAERSRHISRGAVVREKDDTVPQPSNIHSWDDGGHARFRDSYPAHTRVTHHELDAVCTFAYGVSQAGARRILYDLGLWKMDDPFDLGLRQFCDGTFEHKRHVCLTTQPSLFSHFTKQEGSDLDHDKTWNIRWSARENLVKLMDGQDDYDDQWPDTLWRA